MPKRPLVGNQSHLRMILPSVVDSSLPPAEAHVSAPVAIGASKANRTQSRHTCQTPTPSSINGNLAGAPPPHPHPLLPPIPIPHGRRRRRRARLTGGPLRVAGAPGPRQLRRPRTPFGPGHPRRRALRYGALTASVLCGLVLVNMFRRFDLLGVLLASR